ncbi:hypothetical protein RKD28_006961 [Streptomyces sp. SAI-229]
MCVDGAVSDHHVARSPGHQRRHIPFTRAEPPRPGVRTATGERPGDGLGADGGAAVRHPVRRVGELPGPAGPFL